MSLVEDILDVLRIVLEYFGVPPDMLVPVWDSQLCGQYRSIVRMIGTNLPLTPTPRVHFQIPLLTHRPHGYVDDAVETPSIPSFADVMWVFEDEGESFAKTRNHLPPKTQSTVNRNMVRYQGPRPQSHVQRGGGAARQTTDPEALKKITALESELLKLRAQIAMIVTAAPASGLTESQNTPGTPLMSPPPLPALTSTPRCAAPPPPPPPPPPPLPPPCPASSTETSSVFELIRQRRKKEKDQDLPQDSKVKGLPSMLDVLKDLNQVKLRSVKRSPGGTPVRKRRSKGGAALLNDPAALIAEALKRKFAQHRHNSSSDKENSLELSPFGSPETPKVPLHIRRSQGRLHL
ncbi:mitochondrial fission regulator 2 [Plectropomus leopardus]|uniref:mitochondrial fission regulator 2 n=1 Tax=Plectropomus leopardus TaxID=160734 RepID=UPI001C4AAD9B|nr:mitochondrial fission regulator 2 [Plectropomus leopardus]